MIQFTRLILRHRLLVVCGWLALVVAGAATAGLTTSRLSTSFTFPGQDGYRTNLQIAQQYQTGGSGTPVVVLLQLPTGASMHDSATAAKVGAAFDAARTTGPVRIVDFATTGDPTFVLADGGASYGLIFTPPDPRLPDPAPGLAATVEHSAPAGAHAEATGFAQLAAAGTSSGGVGVVAETLIGGIGALVVLAIMFASFLAVLPLLIAVVSIMTTFLGVLGLTGLTDVSFIAEFLISLIGLGVAIDYSLLLVTRWREERAKGTEARRAVEVAMASAGKAVLLSGVTVAVGLASLVLVPVPFLRSLGFSGVLIPLVSVTAALTLLPIVLYTCGDRLDWPHRRTQTMPSRSWTWWARAILRRRWIAATSGAIILGLLVVPFLGMHIGEVATASLSGTGPVRVALDDLQHNGAGTGVLTPIEVLVRPEAATTVRDQAAALPGVRAALTGTTPDFHRGDTAIVDVLPAAEAGSAQGAHTLDTVIAATKSNPDVLGVGGTGALDRDFNRAVYGHFPLILTALSLATFLILIIMFRSILLPAKAVVFNVLSLAAAYGILTLIWQDGVGSRQLWGVPATGAITIWVPFIIFAFLFGLSMDYEVFILSRIREEYRRTGDTDTAIVEGLGRTGGLITGAALILFLAFLSLSTAPATEVKMVGTALGAGILLDATIIRALLLPAVLSLLGRAAWWMPHRRPQQRPPGPSPTPVMTTSRPGRP